MRRVDDQQRRTIMLDHRLCHPRPTGQKPPGDSRFGRLNEADILYLVGQQRIAMVGDIDDDHPLSRRDGHRRQTDDDMRVDQCEHAATQREQARDMRRRGGNANGRPDRDDRVDRPRPQRNARVRNAGDKL
jgi:hypothetical protein